MPLDEAKAAIDRVIAKARVHLYKPIQVAEVLYRDRVHNDITLSDVETYRTASRRWRDVICVQFLGRTSSSSARFQDDLFTNMNATPPRILEILGEENNNKSGIVEKYIYDKFSERYTQMASALNYCTERNAGNFQLREFLDLFWNEPGLKRSIDKIYEIIVFSLFSTLIEEIEVMITVSFNRNKAALLEEFQDFSDKIIGLNPELNSFTIPAKLNRVGVTNAADRGLDMWANYGTVVQIKHLSLDERIAEDIVSSVSANKIVIVCKDCEERVITSLLSQIGWKSKIQSIIKETELIGWYEKALRGRYSESLSAKLLQSLQDEIVNEFPSTNTTEFEQFYNARGYDELNDACWCT